MEFARKFDNQLTKMLLNVYFKKTLDVTKTDLSHDNRIIGTKAVLGLKKVYKSKISE